MKKIMTIAFILLATLLIMVACAPKEVEKTPTIVPAKQVTAPAAEDATVDQDVAGVDQEVIEIDEITGDLDLNDLEELDKELQNIENLEI